MGITIQCKQHIINMNEMAKERPGGGEKGGGIHNRKAYLPNKVPWIDFKALVPTNIRKFYANGSKVWWSDESPGKSTREQKQNIASRIKSNQKYFRL